MGTFIVAALLVMWLAVAIRYTLKNGSGDCSSGCGNCSSKASCSSSDSTKVGLYEQYRQDHKKPVS